MIRCLTPWLAPLDPWRLTFILSLTYESPPCPYYAMSAAVVEEKHLTETCRSELLRYKEREGAHEADHAAHNRPATSSGGDGGDAGGGAAPHHSSDNSTGDNGNDHAEVTDGSSGGSEHLESSSHESGRLAGADRDSASARMMITGDQSGSGQSDARAMNGGEHGGEHQPHGREDM